MHTEGSKQACTALQITIQGLPNAVKKTGADATVEPFVIKMKHLMETLLFSIVPSIVRFDIRMLPISFSVGLRPSSIELISLMLHRITKPFPAHEKVASCPSNTLADCGGWAKYQKEGKYLYITCICITLQER